MYIREYDHFTSAGPVRVSRSIHPYHELIFFSSGELNMHWIGNAYKAEAPALFVFTPSSPHHIDQISSLLACWFIEVRMQDTDFIPCIEMLHAWNLAQSELNWEQAELADIRLTLTSISRMVTDKLPNTNGEKANQILACDVQKLLLQIDQYMTACHSSIDPLRAHNTSSDKWTAQTYMYSLIRHMENNFAGDITLEDLSKRSGYTPSYIIRLFKEMTGLTPFQYLNELRMQAATSYLKSTGMNMREIAEAIGFPSIHYFSRMFKKKFGQSPTEWKKSHSGV
ncbi:helix-turn-helix transcriptional regulator [Paenibacillus mendelii]|uniref:Helix-turn-helix transcriptional regulator n=1 Tax=Paenibacillus mendelii TaxID=206163 RepID=A0ABV6J2Z2_9BACL|nr:AraC family transcriptional regulator [Paenibacillus mendelii]MCQ6562839.1 AraC family transcriptional regulator [Paenibacillus mendelii]